MTGVPDVRSLAADLRRLGVRPGQDLIVHSSLSSLGPVAGGPATLLAALREAAGPLATIVVPTHTPGNSASSTRYRVATAGLTTAGLAGYVAGMPGFDPQVTPSTGMGIFAEYIRKSPDSVRSAHPQTSFAAIGPRAGECVAGHALECHLGELSPLGWLDRNGAAVLLLGVGYGVCTAFHLAEYRLPDRPAERVYRCYVLEGERRRELVFKDLALADSDFESIGERMDPEPFVRRGQVGAADCRLFPVNDAVRFALSCPSFQRLRRVARATGHGARDRRTMNRTAGPQDSDTAGSAPPGGRPPAPPDKTVSAPGGRPPVPPDKTVSAPGGRPPVPPDTTGRYFFLSYPRLCPLPEVAGVLRADRPDELVRLFFHDLSEAVRDRAPADSALRPGFLDVGGPAAPDWRTALVDAIGSAEVFVPLLSTEYVRRSWPRREWASFERRLEDAGVRDPQSRLASVLWAPLPAGERPPEFADALSLARGAARGPYEEYGLRTLLRLDPYHGFYRQIVGELAWRIVTLSGETPVGPSPARDPWQLRSPVSTESKGPVFAVVVATPSAAAGRYAADGFGHDEPGESWRPFGGEQGATLAEYAALAAEQLDFAVVTAEFEKSAGLLRRMPGVVLVDSSYVAGAEGAAAFEEIVAGLPSWAPPVVIADEGSAPHLAKVRAAVSRSYTAHKYKPDAVRRGLRGVSSLQEFVTLMPFIVGLAEREYLRHGPIQRSEGEHASRMRLTPGARPSYQHPKESPDV